VMLVLLLLAGDSLALLAPLRWLLGALMILYVPGYSLQAALFPHRTDLDGIERVGLSIGLSIVLVPVLALILHSTPWKLGMWSFASGTILIILFLGGSAIWRRAQLPLHDLAPTLPALHPQQWWRNLPTLEQRIYRWLAGAAGVILLTLVVVFTLPTPDTSYTEFYMLGSAGLAEQYPLDPRAGDPLQVTMGIVNQEQTTRTYRVEVWATWAWDPANWHTLTTEAGPFTLEPGERLEQPLMWAMPWEADDVQVSFLLFRADDNEPYRTLQLWLDVGAE
ncbi:MAG: DUF1616 domain-containing protein, partial [Chloroflexaceae bacterium]|nr:DUF1616 domain-containing protein [Chloroflexaceae bacterium]